MWPAVSLALPCHGMYGMYGMRGRIDLRVQVCPVAVGLENGISGVVEAVSVDPRNTQVCVE